MLLFENKSVHHTGVGKRFIVSDGEDKLTDFNDLTFYNPSVET